MAKVVVPDAVYWREIIDYNPKTGKFKWKKRLIVRGKFTYYRSGWNNRVGHLSPDGYIRIQFRNRKQPLLAHRLAYLWMIGRWPRQDIDHINRDRADNRWKNLREVSRSQNCRNNKLNGRAGISWDRYSKSWKVYIWREKVGHIHIGRFKTKDKAMQIARLLRMPFE